MKIGIITGGVSGEREISLASAENVRQILNIPKNLFFDYPKNLERIKKSSVDVFIPLIHGVGGEDGEVQQILEELGIPYVFSKPEVHKMLLDKQVAKEQAEKLDVLVPQNKDSAPAFIKPRYGGSSVETLFTESQEEFDKFLNKHKDTVFLKEEAVRGREFTVAVIDSGVGGVEALPVIEIKPKGEFFDYESKYDPNKLAEEVCPAQIGVELRNKLQETAKEIHRHCGCRHVSRTDFILSEAGEVYYLETNTIPGMTKTSLLPKTVQESGKDFSKLLRDWCSDAVGVKSFEKIPTSS